MLADKLTIKGALAVQLDNMRELLSKQKKFFNRGDTLSVKFRANALKRFLNIIEKYEGFNNVSIDQIDAYLDRINYTVSSQSGNTASYAADNPGTECARQGYCIKETLNNDGSGTNYVVTTFVQVSFFGFDNLAGISFTVPISGEVRIPIRSV